MLTSIHICVSHYYHLFMHFFLGIGAVGERNADPGFEMPCPMGLATIEHINSGWFPLFNLYMLGFWWVVIVGTLLTGKLIKDCRSSRRPIQ